MSEEEKNLVNKIETLCKYLDVWKENYTIVPEDKRYLETALNLIQKQDKIIDKMAEQFYNLYRNVEVVRDSFDMPFGKFLKSKEEVIEYFKKECESDEI